MSLARSIRAVIFDLDGTLADTFPLIVKAWNAGVGPETGLVYSDAEVIARFGIPDPQMIRRELKGGAGERADAAYHAAYAREHSIVKAFDGVDDMLAELNRRKVPTGLMTGKGKQAVITLEAAFGWSKAFGSVITGKDVKVQSPIRRELFAVAQSLGVEPAACMIRGAFAGGHRGGTECRHGDRRGGVASGVPG